VSGAPKSVAGEDRLSLLLVGVGGQGVLTTAKILGTAAQESGVPVVVGQLHGMSQRGGSVECTVLLGPGESSFLIGDADVVVGFEPLELLRALPRVGRATSVLATSSTITPWAFASAGDAYPPVEELLQPVEQAAARLTRIDGPALVREAGERRSLNMVMLGALAGLSVLPFDGEALWRAAGHELSPRYRESNRKAFELGLEASALRGNGDG